MHVLSFTHPVTLESFRRLFNEVVKWPRRMVWVTCCALHSLMGLHLCKSTELNEPHLSIPDSPFEDTHVKDTYLIPRNIMAEPDYIEDDNPELIRPQKLVNPVKTSRNHQDLHRELLMNQKR